MVAPVMAPRAFAAPPDPASATAASPAPATPPAATATPTLPQEAGAPAPGINPLDPAGAAIRRSIPLAPAVKGNRPRSNPSVLPPAATELPASELDLSAPASLSLPVKPEQVRIRELRPLGMPEAETLAEVNNPNLKSLASRVEQAQSALRAEISRWYPTLTFNAGNFPVYRAGENSQGNASGRQILPPTVTKTSILQMDAALQLNWALIDPARTPAIAAARDRYEKAKNDYLIGLRELRLQVAEAYFELQKADEQVRIGQESVRASLVSLRDARARFQAGVATKLEVLEAETQLARDQQLLTNALLGRSATGLGQAAARRNLASLLDLPQDVTPTAKDPSRPVGVWLPSLQESIVAAYAFREELDQLLLDISIANSTANQALAQVQPLLNLFNRVSGGRSYGYANQLQPTAEVESWSIDNTLGLNLSWTLFDGGRARAEYRARKQLAEENRYNFARERDQIRREVEENWYTLEQNNRNITTTSREVLSARESLRLARLRFQAGVTTQREVVDNQRDLTQAEVRWSNAIADYNISLARLRRFTGLDQIAICPRPTLPAARPGSEATDQVPVEPSPLLPACSADITPKSRR
ncbi:MAG: TolC family protein [Synechococcaceae cyanobacterium]